MFNNTIIVNNRHKNRSPILKILIKLLCLIFTVTACWQIAHADTLNIQLNGLDAEILDNVQTRLDIVKNALGEDPFSEDIEQFYQQAPENILKSMQPYGYYNPIITGDLQQTGDDWNANFTIQMGPEVHITSINANILGAGQHEPIFRDLLNNFPLQKGDVFLIQNYNKAKRALFDAAEHSGYLDGQLLHHEVRVDPQNNTASISLLFDTGEQFYFGPVNFNETPFSEAFLQRFVHFDQGKPYSTSDILTLQDDLSRSGYFQQVKIDPLTEGTQYQQVPVDIYLEPRKSQRYSLGAGYGTDTGVRGTLAWELRRLNDRGHRLQAFAQGSQIQNTVQGQYIIPGRKPVTDQYNIGASLFNLDLPNSQSRAALLTVAAITDTQEWRRILSVNALYERFRNLDNPKETAFILYHQATWQIIQADNLMFPSQGYRIATSTLGSTKALASDIDFAQFEVEAKGIYSITNGTRFIGRSSFGYTAINNRDTMQLPTSLQFFTGGSETVRGYSYLSLGPGRILLTASGELQQRIISKWYLAAFYDAGNAVQEFPLLLQTSWGAGIIRETLIGPVRLYLAQALDIPGKPTRLIFSVGPDFI